MVRLSVSKLTLIDSINTKHAIKKIEFLEKSNKKRNMQMTVCVLAYNEEKNLEDLLDILRSIKNSRFPKLNFAILDNGSDDNTWEILQSPKFNFIQKYQLPKNKLYGGGMKELIRVVNSQHICLLPADNPYSADDILKVLHKYCASSPETKKILVKGRRIKRQDPLSIKALSFIYNLCNRIFYRTGLQDTNGLPKIFSTSSIIPILDKFPNDAVFDAALCRAWKRQNGTFEEIGILYKARRFGNPSWSSRKLLVAIKMFTSLAQLGFSDKFGTRNA
jgi:glycosyltransferase involved in cell wall biosynthesis